MLRLLLFPFALVYDVITRIRNFLYDLKILRSQSFSIPIILVGNLSVGGTGKTPMIDFLIDYLLSKGLKVTTLSRGYGRKSSGFRVVSVKESPDTIGDEPYTYFEKYGDKIKITVGENRVAAIEEITQRFPATQVILMDDAFQHRAIRAGFNIVLTTQQKPFWKDYLMPAGSLREATSGIKRADCLVITKSQYTLERKFSLPVFQTTVVYGKPVVLTRSLVAEKYIAVAGLASNDLFFEYVRRNFEVLKCLGFKDHQNYTSTMLRKIKNEVKDIYGILTTHKDAVKLARASLLEGTKLVYIPIQVEFKERKEQFLQMIDDYISGIHP